MQMIDALEYYIAEYGNQILDPSLIWEWNPILIH